MFLELVDILASCLQDAGHVERLADDIADTCQAILGRLLEVREVRHQGALHLSRCALRLCYKAVPQSIQRVGREVALRRHVSELFDRHAHRIRQELPCRDAVVRELVHIAGINFTGPGHLGESKRTVLDLFLRQAVSGSSIDNLVHLRDGRLGIVSDIDP